MLKKISDSITALRQYLHQIHLCSRNKDYAGHLLAERLGDPLNDTIDRIKEISLGLGEELSIAYATNSLNSASVLLTHYPQGTNTQEMWHACKKLEMQTCDFIEEACIYYTQKNTFGLQGILNALGDISEQRIRDIYLIDIQLANSENQKI